MSSPPMNDDEPLAEALLRAKLNDLKVEHQDLNDSIHALEQLPLPDQIQLARLKRKKLGLKDQMAKIESELTPDIIA
jgi:hypothetical protein